MEIAVTPANHSTSTTQLEQTGVPVDLGESRISNPETGGEIEHVYPELAEGSCVASDDPFHASLSTVLGRQGCGCVELGNCVCQQLHQRHIEATTAGETVEQVLLVEPVHFDDPVNGQTS